MGRGGGARERGVRGVPSTPVHGQRGWIVVTVGYAVAVIKGVEELDCYDEQGVEEKFWMGGEFWFLGEGGGEGVRDMEEVRECFEGGEDGEGKGEVG